MSGVNNAWAFYIMQHMLTNASSLYEGIVDQSVLNFIQTAVSIFRSTMRFYFHFNIGLPPLVRLPPENQGIFGTYCMIWRHSPQPLFTRNLFLHEYCIRPWADYLNRWMLTYTPAYELDAATANPGQLNYIAYVTCEIMHRSFEYTHWIYLHQAPSRRRVLRYTQNSNGVYEHTVVEDYPPPNNVRVDQWSIFWTPRPNEEEMSDSDE